MWAQGCLGGCILPLVAEDSWIFSFSAAGAPGEIECSLVSNLSLPLALKAPTIPCLARGWHCWKPPTSQFAGAKLLPTQPVN